MFHYKLTILIIGLVAAWSINGWAQITPTTTTTTSTDTIPRPASDSSESELNRPLGDTTRVFYTLFGNATLHALDTTLQDFERVNVTWNDSLPTFQLDLGSLASPLAPMEYHMTQRGGFWLGLEAYKPYQLQRQQVRFYRIGKRRPFTDLYYSQHGQKNSVIRAIFAHEVAPRLYYSLQYSLVNALGYYQRQKHRNQNINLSMQLISKNNRYEAFIVALHNVYNNFENGGVANDASVDSVATNAELEDVDMRLTKATNQLRRTEVTFSHYYYSHKIDSFDISNAPVRFGHRLTYETNRYKYFDTAPSSAYEDYYGIFDVNARGIRQFVVHQLFENELNVRLGLGGGFAKAPMWLTVAGFQRLHWLNLETEKQTIQNFGASGRWQTNPQRKYPFQFDVLGQVVWTNAKGLDMLLDGRVRYQLKNWAIVEGQGWIQRYQPSQVAQKMYVSRSLVWDNANLQQVQEFSWLGRLSIPKTRTSLEIQNHTISNYLYTDSTYRILQYGDVANVMQIRVKQNFRVWRFHLDNEALWQRILAGSDVLRLPEFSLKHSLYGEGKLFKTMFVRTGASVRWWSSYYMNGYMPLTQQFYVQNQLKANFYPVIDYFISARVYQMRVFVNVENILQMVTLQPYFVAPHYTQPNWLIRLGFSWRLFD